MKICPNCKEEKEPACFYKSSRTKDGLRCYCKSCEALRNREREPNYKATRKSWRESNPEKYTAMKRDYYQRNKIQILESNAGWRQTAIGRFNSYKKSALKRRIFWNLTFKEFTTYWQKPCWFCGEEIGTIGLDRFDTSAGYSISNVVPCCTMCNKMKLNYTFREFIEHTAKIQKHLKHLCDDKTITQIEDIIKQIQGGTYENSKGKSADDG